MNEIARYSGATWRPLPEADQQPTIRANQIILHIAVSNADSLYPYWNSTGVGLESHLYVTKAGGAEQYVGTDHSADANLEANRRPDGTGALSVETQGGVGADVNAEWTGPQIDRIIDFIRWAHEVHGIPYRLCRDPADPGIGWHVMFGAPGPWTPAVGKVCPGPGRIAQVKNVIMPRLLGQQEDDMFEETDRAKLDQLHRIFTLNNTAGDVNALVDMVTQIKSAVAAQGDDESVIVGALAARPITLTDEQTQQLADRLGVDYEKIRAAVQFNVTIAPAV